MDHKAAQQIQAQLSPGESLLWWGRPRQGVVFRASDLFVIPFSLLWGGFAIYWAYGAYRSGAPGVILLIGAAFVLIGVYIILGRFVVDTLTRRHTCYGVTDDRVLIVNGFPTTKTRSMGLSTLTNVTFSSKPDHSGSIAFGSHHAMAEMVSGMHWPGTGEYHDTHFEMIENVKSVYDTIQQARRDLDQANR